VSGTQPSGDSPGGGQGGKDPSAISSSQSDQTLPSDLPVLPGITLQYEIARGGMGVVYSGRQDFLDRRVAVKFLSMDLGGEAFAKRFQREAKILAGISHPNIVGCHMADTTPEGQSYLVMEFIDGPSLKAWIQDNGPISSIASLRLIRSSALALAHAHISKIIHRDVKPENILLESLTSTAIDINFPYVPKLVDLGLARMTHEQVGAGLTSPGSVMGTPATMSPEQFDDPDSVDFRSDIYGLGCCLFEMLVGKPAFRSKKLTDIVVQKREAVPPNPCAENQGIPPAVGAFTQRMMASNRDDRPATYKQLDQEIRDLVDALQSVSSRTDTIMDLNAGQTMVTPSARPGAPSAFPPAGTAMNAGPAQPSQQGTQPSQQGTQPSQQGTGPGVLNTGELNFLAAGSEQTGARAATAFHDGTGMSSGVNPPQAKKSSAKLLTIGISAAVLLAVVGYALLKKDGVQRIDPVVGPTGSNTRPVVQLIGPETADIAKDFVLEAKATDAEEHKLTYLWDFPRDLVLIKSPDNEPTARFEINDGLPGVPVKFSCSVSDDQPGSEPVVKEHVVLVGECPDDLSIFTWNAPGGGWTKTGKWYIILDPLRPGVTGRKRRGAVATMERELGDESYWEWYGTVEPFEDPEGLEQPAVAPQSLVAISYGNLGYGVRFNRTEGDTKWSVEIVEREPGLDSWNPLAEPMQKRWVTTEETVSDQRAWFSISRRRDELVVQIGRFVQAAPEVGKVLADPEVVKQKPVRFSISAEESRQFGSGGKLYIEAEKAGSRFRISRR
jgi:serine/threonine protein kinase